MILNWKSDRIKAATCPVCEKGGPKNNELSFHANPDALPIDYLRCDGCGSLFVDEFVEPAYEIAPPTFSSNDFALKYYIEQGAGLETLVLPAMLGKQRNISRYLEIGCGFGFGLDFAMQSFPWQVRGIDPGDLARAGKKMLKLPIENTYLRKDVDVEEKYDLIAAVEVIEHFKDPFEMLSTMAAQLATDGILFLTTPNAGAIGRDKDSAGLIAALSPGYHAILFSVEGLKVLLSRAGFQEMNVVPRGMTIMAASGMGAAAVDWENLLDKELYRKYLTARAQDSSLEPDLVISFNSRLFKHLVNNNLLDEASEVYIKLERLIFIRDRLMISNVLDVINRLSYSDGIITPAQNFPFSLTSIFYLRAIIYLNVTGDGYNAAQQFFACWLTAVIFRRTLLAVGIDDGEIADLEKQAKKHLALMFGENSPWSMRLPLSSN